MQTHQTSVKSTSFSWPLLLIGRCEVTADDFETASMSKYSEVVGKLLLLSFENYLTGFELTL